MGIGERIAIVQHESIQHLSGEIAILKKYLKSKRVPEDALGELDSLCKDTEERWQVAVAKIAKLLEELVRSSRRLASEVQHLGGHQ